MSDDLHLSVEWSASGGTIWALVPGGPQPIGLMDSPQVAGRVVELHNQARQLRRKRLAQP